MPEEDKLKGINPDDIERNPENPRLIFREDEMNELLNSIRKVGIQVPISIYFDDDKDKHFLIDGERRWRCAKKLNMAKVPAIIHPKPNRLENILTMFNIHNVSVAWDLMPMALKLKDIKDLLEQEGKPASPKDLATLTGVRLPTIKRALDLLDLPERYRNMLLKEAEKPRDKQTITPDLFIEIYKSLHAIERHIPEVLEEVPKKRYIDAMVDKYVSGVVKNVVRYRDVSKIARAELAGGDKTKVTPTIVKLVKNKEYTIEQAFADSTQADYERRDLLTRLKGLTEKLSKYRTGETLDTETRAALKLLKNHINRLLGNE